MTGDATDAGSQSVSDLLAAIQAGTLAGGTAVYATMKAFGVTMVQGLVDGILQQTVIARRAGGTLVGDVLDQVSTNLGNPHSPAPVVIPFGRSIPEGIMAGIQQGQQMAVAAAQAMTQGVVQAIRPGPLPGFSGLAYAGAGYGSGAITFSTPITVNVSGAAAGNPQGIASAVQQAVEKELNLVIRQLRGGVSVTNR